MSDHSPEHDNDNLTEQPEAEKQQAPTEKKSIPKSTTYDVASDADEAMRRFEAHQQNEALNRDLDARTHQMQNWENMMLRVEVQGGGTPLLLPLSADTVIGRRDPSTETSPELDLTPYGAYQMGISRRHAIIRLQDDVPVLTDLGSRNGTYINGKKLKAHQAVPLKDGDEVRLGKIVMQIYFQTEEDAE